MKTKGLIIVVLLTLLALPALTEATSITIANAGFEEFNKLSENQAARLIPGWHINGIAGTWNPQDFKYYKSDIPEGLNIGYINSGEISQMLNYFLLPHTQLELTLSIGLRNDKIAPNYSVELFAGNNLLTSGFAPLVDGEFVTLMLTYDVTSDNPYLGQQISIRINKSGLESSQLNIDNLSMHNQPLPVPEPSSLLLLVVGIIGLGFFKKKK